ncbi:MAG: glycosyltransferase family 9 protein [Bacteroidota bacterium]
MGPESLRTDCRWFKGWIPCRPHKETGVHCTEPDGTVCPQYDRITERILIIKLGAVGDVIRTTPILHAFKRTHPAAHIWWLTLTPEILPSQVDVPLPFTPQSLATLGAVRFDLLVNLDKDREACALAATLNAKERRGFTLKDGIPVPVDADAVHKYMTGLFDDLSRANTKSYVQEVFEISGLTFAGEPYILDSHAGEGYRWKLPKGKAIIGLNTGCGGRWTSRLWPERHWAALARRLKQAGMVPLLLGGEQEDARNKRIARRSGALYFGTFPLPQFINLVDQCTLVVTAVTMALHIAVGLRKRVVLFNNIFNRHEFELYGLGTIVEPDPPCTCYYAAVCTDPRRGPHGCMPDIPVTRVVSAVTALLKP